MNAVVQASEAQPLAVTAMSHYVCCEVELPEGTMCRSLCGTLDAYESGDTDAVECVVCTDLDRIDFCPDSPSRRCEWGVS